MTNRAYAVACHGLGGRSLVDVWKVLSQIGERFGGFDRLSFSDKEGEKTTIDHLAGLSNEALVGAVSLSAQRLRSEYAQVVFGWTAAVTISSKMDGAVIALPEDACRGQEFDVAREIWNQLAPEYGYAYSREYAKGPDLYAFGLIAGLPYSKAELEESDRITRWRKLGIGERKFRHGALRDIYPLNCVSAIALGRLVGDVSLRTWLSSQSASLVPLNGGRWLLTAPTNDALRLRSGLMGSGILLACA